MLRALSLVLAAAMALSACSSDDSDGLRWGRSVYGDSCSVCHGARGEGEIGPALDGVIDTWPSCVDQILWIALGSSGWMEQNGETYGANSKTVEGGMPGQADVLQPDEMAAVAAFERSEYGGRDPDVALAECGVE